MTMVGKTKLASTSKGHGIFIYIVIFLLILSISIIFDIPVLRQILGFIFLTFIPGWLILSILKLNKLGMTEKLVLCVGLSVAFTMFAGLLINTIYPLFGYPTPLTTNSLLISFSIITLILAVIAYFRNKDIAFINISAFQLNTTDKIYLLLPAFFPLLAILGIRIMNSNGNNIMLMVLLLLIPAYVIFMAILHNKVPDGVYAPIIFCISISLILLLGLRSNHVIGADIHTEYYIFHQTLDNGKWQLLMNNTLDSCLSISILPTVYQSFININTEYLFKILYPVLFSISPLVVYIISRKYLNRVYSFIASIFFMSQIFFLTAEMSPRTVTAILFSALAFMVLIHNRLKSLQKYLLFIIFAASCIISHYSTTYIFLSILLLTWIVMQIVPWIYKKHGPSMQNSEDVTNNIRNGLSFSKFQPKHYITFGVMAIAFVMMFFWYSQITGPAFNSGVSFITTSFSSMQNFFDMESRGASAMALGSGIEAKTIPQQLFFVFTWMTILFVAVGVLTTLLRYRHTIAIYSESETKAPQYLVQKLDLEYFILSLVCSLVLALAVALPYVFVGYDMNRTYSQMMVILSPFFVIGGIMIARIFRNKLSYSIILLALIPYFMCTTGTTYQIFGISQAIILNSKGQDYDVMYVHEQETFAAKWTRKNVLAGNKIYADYFGGSRLISQGTITFSIYMGTLIENNKPLGDGYIYVRYTGVVDRKLLDSKYIWHDFDNFQYEFNHRNLVYDNGGSQIWK